MRRLACVAATVALIATSSCRKQQPSQTGGANATIRPPSTVSAPAAAAPDSASSPGEFSFDQRQSFTQSIRQQLGDIDRQIQDLSAQAKSRGGAVSDRALANIRASRKAVDRSLSRVQAATAANWDQTKKGINQAVDNLSESIQAAQPK